MLQSEQEGNVDRRVGWALLGITFLGLAVLPLQRGGFQEADEVTHLSFAKSSTLDLRFLVDIWGRPLASAYWALPALAGAAAAKIATAAATILGAYFAGALVSAQGARLAAIGATLGMPLLLNDSVTVLTEPLFAALLAGACVAHARGRLRLAALLFGSLPMVRPEGFLLGPLIACWFLWGGCGARFRQRVGYCVLLLVPVLAWWWLGLAAYRNPHWFFEAWPKVWGVESQYGHGHPLLYAAFLALLSTPWLWPACVLGALRAKAHGHLLPLFLIVAVVGAHTALHASGAMGSAGYPRYLVTVAPLLGAFAGVGVVSGLQFRNAGFRWRVGLPIVFAAMPWWMDRPEVPPRAVDQVWMEYAVPAAESLMKGAPDAWLIVDHPMVGLLSDRESDVGRKPFSLPVLTLAPRGSVAIVETKFALRWGRIPQAELLPTLRAAGFEPVPAEALPAAPDVRGLPTGGDRELDDFRGDVWRKVR